ncbi:hypothetical protein BDZ45DRAFT_269270 [Acephala macrosclerotiorum]|nr:hypothetical protein BDZ45DRAFT_269270 [Acephala macrosclerotiorum]
MQYIKRLLSGRHSHSVYIAVANDEPKDISPYFQHHQPSWTFSRITEMIYCSMCVLMFVSGTWMLLFARRIKPTDAQCAGQVSVWSPILEAVEYGEVNWVNYFTHKTPCRGPPTPELEQKWLDLQDFPSISIPASKIPLNRSIEEGFKPALPPFSPATSPVSKSSITYDVSTPFGNTHGSTTVTRYPRTLGWAKLRIGCMLMIVLRLLDWL